MNLFLAADFRGQRFLEFQPLLESGVTVARVTTSPKSSRPHLGVDLLHDLSEVSRRQGLHAVLVAVFTEKEIK